jgi:hypothetical protein
MNPLLWVRRLSVRTGSQGTDCERVVSNIQFAAEAGLFTTNLPIEG